MPKTTIQISEETKAQLTAQGRMGETYDQLIRRLLGELTVHRVNEERRIKKG